MEKTNDEKRYCIYMHRFRDNGKVYIGQTCRKPEKRWGKNGKVYLNKRKDGTYLQPLFARAIIKYGWDNADHIILFENLDKKSADRIEQICILLFRSNRPSYGYNCDAGGGGTVGYKHTEEAKEKMRKPHYGVRGANNPSCNRVMSDEERKRRGESVKNRIAKNGHPMFGKHHSEESKRKNSESHVGHRHLEETKKKMSQTRKGRPPFNYKSVFCFELNKVFLTIKEASIHTNANYSGIGKCCDGNAKTAGKMHWRYATQDEIIAEKQHRGIEVA